MSRSKMRRRLLLSFFSFVYLWNTFVSIWPLVPIRCCFLFSPHIALLRSFINRSDFHHLHSFQIYISYHRDELFSFSLSSSIFDVCIYFCFLKLFSLHSRLQWLGKRHICASVSVYDALCRWDRHHKPTESRKKINNNNIQIDEMSDKDNKLFVHIDWCIWICLPLCK